MEKVKRNGQSHSYERQTRRLRYRRKAHVVNVEICIRIGVNVQNVRAHRARSGARRGRYTGIRPHSLRKRDSTAACGLTNIHTHCMPTPLPPP